MLHFCYSSLNRLRTLPHTQTLASSSLWPLFSQIYATPCHHSSPRVNTTSSWRPSLTLWESHHHAILFEHLHSTHRYLKASCFDVHIFIFYSLRTWTWSVLITAQIQEHCLAHNRNSTNICPMHESSRLCLNDTSSVRPSCTPLLGSLRDAGLAIPLPHLSLSPWQGHG